MPPINLWLPWVVSVFSIACPVLTGRGIRSGWILHICLSIVGIGYYTITDQIGFIPASIAALCVYVRNYRAWGRPTPCTCASAAPETVK